MPSTFFSPKKNSAFIFPAAGSLAAPVNRVLVWMVPMALMYCRSTHTPFEPLGAGDEGLRRVDNRSAKGDAGGIHGPGTSAVAAANATSGLYILEDHISLGILVTHPLYNT
jgi:hypothetical protein